MLKVALSYVDLWDAKFCSWQSKCSVHEVCDLYVHEIETIFEFKAFHTWNN